MFNRNSLKTAFPSTEEVQPREKFFWKRFSYNVLGSSLIVVALGAIGIMQGGDNIDHTSPTAAGPSFMPEDRVLACGIEDSDGMILEDNGSSNNIAVDGNHFLGSVVARYEGANGIALLSWAPGDGHDQVDLPNIQVPGTTTVTLEHRGDAVDTNISAQELEDGRIRVELNECSVRQ